LNLRGQERILKVTSDVQGRQAELTDLFVQTFTALQGQGIGQHLPTEALAALRGPCACACALADPAFW